MDNETAQLWDAIRELAALRDPGAFFELMAAQAASLANSAAGAVYLADPAAQVVELAAARDFPVSAGLRVPASRTFSGQVARGGQAVLLDGAASAAAYADVPPGRAVLGVPLIFQSEAIGVLLAARAAAGEPDFTEADRTRLARYAELAAPLLESIRHLAAAQRRLAEVEAVSRLAAATRLSRTPEEVFPVLLEEALAALKAPAGSFWLYDPANDELVRVAAHDFHAQLPTRLKPNSGVAGRAFTSSQTYAAREFRSDVYAADSVRTQMPAGWGGAGVPLQVAQEVVGALVVTVPLPRELRPEEVRLLTTLAQVAGAGLEQARETREPPRRLQRLAAQRTIDVAITSSLDLNVTLNIILDQATARLEVNAASILLLNQGAQVLEYAAGRGFHTEAITATRLRLDEDQVMQMVVRRKAVGQPNLALVPGAFPRSGLLAGEGFVAYYGVPLIAKGRVKGVLEIFHRAPLQADEEWLEFLGALAAQAAIAIDNALLFADLQRSNVELGLAYDTTLEGWSRALDLRDRESEGHSQRVTELTVRLAQAIGVDPAELVHIRRGALLHDMGKLGVPDSILLKPGKLTEEEWDIMRRHPQYAHDMLYPIEFLRPALAIPYCHHEKWDGSGYPRGLAGEQIPLAARLFAVVDVWDALRSNRPYRQSWPEDKVREHIYSQSGTHFDPAAVQAFLSLPPL